MTGACISLFHYVLNTFRPGITDAFQHIRIILETDSAAIAARVSRPRADTTDIVINEQTLLSAYQTVKERVQQRMQQF